jgi:hypothetical protein
MYNLNNHYNTIFNIVTSIIRYPNIQYLHPFGSTEINYLETISTSIDNNATWHSRTGVMVFCYDQEPLLYDYNQKLFKHVFNHSDGYRLRGKHVILLNTELESDDKDKLLSEFNFIDCYCFFHIFAAHDWFREYYYDKQITCPSTRKLSKKFITFNRLTSNARIYRTLLVNELIKYNLLDDGNVSFSKDCPDGGNFAQQLINNAKIYNIPIDLVNQAIDNINSTSHPLRIDFTEESIPNRSFCLDSIHTHMESFLHIVTETNYWGRRKHLTEKIFKPIILKQPFILIGCAHNLDYLKSYGFKTFDRWWNEDYDNIEDDIERMSYIGTVIDNICKMSYSELEDILKEMQEILDYNFNLFYSREFLNHAITELESNLRTAIDTACWTNEYRDYLIDCSTNKEAFEIRQGVETDLQDLEYYSKRST